MTAHELEAYITKVLPQFRKRRVHSANDDEALQKSLVRLWRKVDTLICADDKAFTALLSSYYYLIKWEQQTAEAKASTKMKLLYWNFDCTQYVDARTEHLDAPYLTNSLVYDPWNTAQSQALEYIYLIKDEVIREILIAYYIEGYTLGDEWYWQDKFGLKKSSISVYLQRGIQWIKQALDKGELPSDEK